MRIDIIYQRRGDEFPLTVDLGYEAPFVEINGIDITGILSPSAYEEIVSQAEALAREDAEEAA